VSVCVYACARLLFSLVNATFSIGKVRRESNNLLSKSLCVCASVYIYFFFHVQGVVHVKASCL